MLLVPVLISVLSVDGSNFIWAQKAAGVESTISYRSTLKYLTNIQFESDLAVVKEEISFKRDVGIFKLFEGTIYACTTLREKLWPYTFQGKGSLLSLHLQKLNKINYSGFMIKIISQ